ncbi:peptidyl-prolyl cis-trans isomerase FKBP1B isoform X2 [Podarcis muralis]
MRRLEGLAKPGPAEEDSGAWCAEQVAKRERAASGARRPWGWKWRPSRRETEGHFQRKARHVWSIIQDFKARVSNISTIKKFLEPGSQRKFELDDKALQEIRKIFNI